ncbi:transcriptional regulator [Dokdonella sp.]|uniref:winged helix-turn-helix domain-containing protein n=1 Tax=Dokdonella sp. TaxID=2291710 RepID=UPI0026040158|nr:transcriptional regulator [Dokdonella sp.]
MTTPTAYRFGDFRLDTAIRTLQRGTDPVVLPPKVFDCVAYLIDHRERAVGRDELIAAVWGKVVVGDGVLGQTILLARKALDDTGREQQVIRTVPRFGYHWLARVETDAADAAAVSPPPMPAADECHDADRLASTLPPSPPHRRPPWRIAAVATACAIAVAAGLASMRPRATSGGDTAGFASAAPKAILVLPVTVSGDDEASWIRFGVMDLIASRLRAAGQEVVPSDNVVALARAYDRAAVDPVQRAILADAAGAALVIEPHAEAREGRWRVTLRAVHGAAVPAAIGEGADVLAAARSAGDRFAAAIGLAPVQNGPAGDPLLQQIEAALLEDRNDRVRALIDQAPAERREQPLLRFQRARAEFQTGDFDAARTTLSRIASDVPPTVDAVLHARALNALAGIELQRSRPAAAMPDLDRAIELLARERAYGPLGKAYNNRAAAHAALHDHAAAQADLAQARIALATAGDALGLAIVDANVGAGAVTRERFAEAVPILSGASERFAMFRAHAPELNARVNLAEAQLALLDPVAALANEARIRGLVEQVNNPSWRRAADLVRVEVLSASGRRREAAALLLQVRREAETQNDAIALSRAQAIAARDALDGGDATRAEHEAAAALAGPAGALDARQTGMARLVRLRALRTLGRTAEADDALDAMQAWARQDGSPTARLHASLAVAEGAAEVSAPMARTAFEEALDVAERERVPVDLVRVGRSYVAWLMRQRDFARASVVVEGIAAWTDRDYDAAVLQLRLFHALRNPAAWPAALEKARALAGERTVPAELARAPEA